MYEVLEVVKRIVLLVGLLYFAWQDYRTRYISVAAAMIVGGIGIVVRLLAAADFMTIFEIITSMLIGMGLIIMSVIWRDGVGIGDGILFFVSGCYLNIFENMRLFLRTIFLMGGFVVLCLIIKKIRKNVQIPMAPFMLMAYVTLG